MNRFDRNKLPVMKVGVAIAAAACVMATPAHAMKLFESNPDWVVNLDTTFQHTLGFRLQNRIPGVGNNPFFAEGDYKFNQGDIVTNRSNAILAFTAIYKHHAGVRISGSGWKDFAYDASVKTNPAFPASFSTYQGNRYSSTTYKYTVQGAEWLDAFAFYNSRVGDMPYYLKAGRFTQYWGNSFFFGFSNIAYGQNSVDYYKAFAQPGSELQELYLPRGQVMGTLNVLPELSLTAQYFLENRSNRYPEGGTYLGPFDILYKGPNQGGALGLPVGIDNHPQSPDFGLRAIWSPDWANGPIGIYYRQFNDPHPWTVITPAPGTPAALTMNYAQRTKLIGLSYERTIGLLSLGAEASYRQNTALATALGPSPDFRGASGDLYNVLMNGLVTLPKTPFWDTGALIVEATYTHLLRVSGNADMYNGIGYGGCPSGNKWDGCATQNALAAAFLFDPTWLQVFPNVNLDMPMSLTIGLNGNPAYVAGAFYAQGAKLYSLGLRATYNSNSSLMIAYNGYYYHHGERVPGPIGGYAGTGGNGAVSLNDKGWLAIVFKTSF